MLGHDYGEKCIENTSCLLSYPSIKISDPLDDELGIIPIHVFAMRGMTSLLQKWLKSHPALVDIRDKWGHTPLHYAVIQPLFLSVSLLTIFCLILFDCKTDHDLYTSTIQMLVGIHFFYIFIFSYYYLKQEIRGKY